MFETNALKNIRMFETTALFPNFLTKDSNYFIDQVEESKNE